MSANTTPALALVRERFEQFAAADGRDDALYVALAHAVAQDDALLALLLEAPPTQRLPVLWLACVHERVLAGSGHPLRDYFASVGGGRAPDAELPALLRDFVQHEHDALRRLLRTRRTQTNEIGRSAVLWAVLQWLRAKTGRHELALLDFGCSAGLNLGVDQYRYRCGALRYGAPADGVPRPELAIDWRGGAPAWLAEPPAWRLRARVGADLSPIHPADTAEARWLQACLWPGDAARRSRLDQALRLAAARADPLLCREDGLAALAQAQQTLDSALQPVLFNSWVLAYLDEAAWHRYCQRAVSLVAEQGWVWISAEAQSRSLLRHTLPAGESAGSASLWTVHWRDGAGRVQAQAVAWSHPHGRWAQWEAGP